MAEASLQLPNRTTRAVVGNSGHLTCGERRFANQELR